MSLILVRKFDKAVFFRCFLVIIFAAKIEWHLLVKTNTINLVQATDESKSLIHPIFPYSLSIIMPRVEVEVKLQFPDLTHPPSDARLYLNYFLDSFGVSFPCKTFICRFGVFGI